MTGFYWANVKEPEFLAQPTDLASYMGYFQPDGTTPDTTRLPANATLILRRTTKQVQTVTQGAFYDVDPATGLPLPVYDDKTETYSTAIGDAMTEATCIQAAAWITLGIDPLLGGTYLGGSVKASTKIGTASTQRAQADQEQAVAARLAALNGLVPAALEVLQHQNLVGNGPWTFG